MEYWVCKYHNNGYCKYHNEYKENTSVLNVNNSVIATLKKNLKKKLLQKTPTNLKKVKDIKKIVAINIRNKVKSKTRNLLMRMLGSLKR